MPRGVPAVRAVACDDLDVNDRKDAVWCNGLFKRYGDVVALAGLDLEVHCGECFGMLGPNGAGKTTSVEIFEGLRIPDSGEVQVLGDRWRGDGLPLRARLGIQLQETKFPDKLQVSEVVTLFRSFYPRGIDVADVLALVGLEEKAARAGAHVVGRSETAALARLRARWRSGAAVPRRADDRTRSTIAPPDLGNRRGLEGPRANRPADHSLHGRGGATVRSRGRG